MKRIALIVLAVLAVLLLLAGAYVLLNKKTDTTTPAGQNPFGSSTNTGTVPGGTTSGTPNLSVPLKDGTHVSIPDFTKQDQPSIAGPDTGYQVAGSETADYQILFFPNDSYFLISLFVEPLGQTRRDAEAALRTKLPLTDTQLCALNSEVMTTADVNETYAGSSLGLSFCPGSTKLP